jgi:hypothetical protein
MNVCVCPFDLSIKNRPFVCHEKTLPGSRRAVAITGRSLRSGLVPDLGKVTERWRRKVTGLKAHLRVSPWQPDRQTGARFGSFVASFG